MHTVYTLDIHVDKKEKKKKLIYVYAMHTVYTLDINVLSISTHDDVSHVTPHIQHMHTTQPPYTHLSTEHDSRKGQR